MVKDTISKIAWTTAKSREPTEVTSKRPMPGQAKTVSVTIDPATRSPSLNPSTVTSGMAAFGKACQLIRRNRGTPLAAAVRI